MSQFYVLPPRRLVADSLVSHLEKLFPGLPWPRCAREKLVEALGDAVAVPPEVYVVHREDLTDQGDVSGALTDGFGAEPGDQVIEITIDRPSGSLVARSWSVPAAA